MATRVVVVKVTGIEEMERRLFEFVEQVEREKEKTRDTFQQLHGLLMIREEGLLRELDGVVVEVRQELKEKRELLQELRGAKESTERELTKNELKEVLEKNLQNLESQIHSQLSNPLNVTWVEVELKREQLETSIVEVFKVLKMKERPFRTEDYSLKLRPVWYRKGTRSSVIEDPKQKAIDTKSGNIFVADNKTKKIQVFDNIGHYLYHTPTPPEPTGLCLSDKFIFVTTNERKLAKIQISNKKTVKSVVTEQWVSGMDISSNVYVCEYYNQSVSVSDKNLNFLKRIPLKSPHFTSYTFTYSIKLYENTMYAMFVGSEYCLQVFSQEGQLIRVVIRRSDIKLSYFFSLDRIGNIIAADYWGHQIRIFSNSGHLIHTISNDTLTQGYSKRGPRATRGPQRLKLWPSVFTDIFVKLLHFHALIGFSRE